MLAPQAQFCMCFIDCLLRSSLAHCSLCVLLPFVTLVSCVLFGMSFLESLFRYCLAHCFVCVLLTL